MIDDRFTLDAFMARGRNTPGAQELASQLQVAIATEVTPDLKRLAQAIAAKLEVLGHSFSSIEIEVEEQGGAVGITVIDISQGRERSQHRLRINLDLVVSAGFPGYQE